MTIDEKLQHFYEVSLDEAREDAARAIQDHKDYLQKVLEEHKQSRIQTAEAEVKADVTRWLYGYVNATFQDLRDTRKYEPTSNVLNPSKGLRMPNM